MRKENLKIGEVYSYSTNGASAFVDPKSKGVERFGLRRPAILVEMLPKRSVKILAPSFHPEIDEAWRSGQATIEQALEYFASGGFQKLQKAPTGWRMVNAYTVNLKEPWQEYETERTTLLAGEKARRDAEEAQKSIYKDARQRCEDHGFYFKDRLNYGGYFTMRADDVVRLADLLDGHHGTA